MSARGTDMRSVGIDPGIGGAMVLLANDVPVEWERMPTAKIGSANRVNAAAVADWLRMADPQHVYVEHVHAMPGQGVTSMFSFGHSTGVIWGVLGALGLPYTLVPPVAWKLAAGLLGKDKDASRARALQLWPFWKELHKKGEGQAYADAALIARVQHG